MILNVISFLKLNPHTFLVICEINTKYNVNVSLALKVTIRVHRRVRDTIGESIFGERWRAYR